MGKLGFPKLRKSVKKYKGYKVCHPRETIARIRNGFRKLGLSVAERLYNNGGVWISKLSLGDRLFTVSGKGISKLLCQASGYAELAERFSACRGTNSLTTRLNYTRERARMGPYCSYADLKEDKVSPDYFFRSFSKDFRRRAGALDLVSRFPLLWEKAYSLVTGKGVFFPILWDRHTQGTNGLAAGNTMEEAIMHGICEVVERYVSSRTILGKPNLPTVDPESASNADLKRLMTISRNANIEFVIKDCSMGLPLPSIGVLFIEKDCMSRDRFVAARNRIFMVGTATDAETAAIRCFMEYVQCNWKRHERIAETFRVWRSLGLRCRQDPHQTMFLHYKNGTRQYDDFFLRKKASTASFSDMPCCYEKDCLLELNRCLSALAGLGHDVFCLNTTHPVLGFPTVHVSIPKLLLADWIPEIDHVFANLAATHEMTVGDTSLKGIVQDSMRLRLGRSANNYLLTEEWQDSARGIRGAIRKIEEFTAADPIEFATVMNMPACELLAYLHLCLGEWAKAYAYSRALPELNYWTGNDDRTLQSYARIQECLEKKSRTLEKELLSHWLIRRMQEDGVSTDIEPKWLQLGGPGSRNPFGVCDFNCRKCTYAHGACLWQRVPIDDFLRARR